MSQGYSLIEVVVTIAIASAALAVAIPSVSSWRARHVVLRETKRVQRALERAYVIAALREKTLITTLFDHSLVVTTQDTTPMFSLTLSPDILMAFKSDEQTAITFYPSLTTTPSTIIVRGPHGRCSVILSLRGRTRRECSW